MPNLDVIYLYKPAETEAEPQTWTYYRVRGDFEDGGTLQVSRVSLPDFKDRQGESGLNDVIDTPGIVGHVTPHLHTLLQAQWGVDHEKSILIGVLEV